MEKLTQQRKLELIDETVKFYSSNPRSVISDNQCMYLSDEGYKCAFSRLCTDEQVALLHESYEFQNIPVFAKGLGIPDEDLQFYVKLQLLHDMPNHWDSIDKVNIFTIEGDNYVRQFKLLVKTDKV